MARRDSGPICRETHDACEGGCNAAFVVYGRFCAALTRRPVIVVENWHAGVKNARILFWRLI